MTQDDHKHSGHFDASLPLPDELTIPHGPQQDAAADLIRHRVDEAYSNAPPAAQEIRTVGQVIPGGKSKHQKFIDDLLDSNKTLPEIQIGWNEYYAGLPDRDKHEVWQEFYSAHERKSSLNEAQEKTPSAKSTTQKHLQKAKQFRESVRSRPHKPIRSDSHRHHEPKKTPSPLRSLLFGLSVGLLVVFIFMFSFFNERFIAPFIQPSRNATNTQIILASHTVSTSNPQIIIPKINVQVPVIYGVTSIEDSVVENALNNGVLHYADTAQPGQDGNVVIIGHSANNILNPGAYKFVFSLLSRVDDGDVFYIEKDGVRYTYHFRLTLVLWGSRLARISECMTSKPRRAINIR